MMRLAVQLHAIRPTECCDASVLSPAERDRAESFRFRADALRWISYRSSMRAILGECLGLPPAEVPILISETGKPLLDVPHQNLHFSLSHTNHLAILALSNKGPVGVDLESLDRAADLLECETAFCHPLEIAALPKETNARQDRLLQLWTMKEAVLKAVGTGFLVPPESVRIEACDGFLHRAIATHSRDLFEPQKIRLIKHPGLLDYRIALSSVGEDWEFIDSGASTAPPDEPSIQP